MQEEEIARKEKDRDLAGKSRSTAGAGGGVLTAIPAMMSQGACTCMMPPQWKSGQIPQRAGSLDSWSSELS